MAERAEEEVTSLENTGSSRSRLISATLVIAVVEVALGLASHEDVYLIVETAVALAVTAVPEGLGIFSECTVSQ